MLFEAFFWNPDINRPDFSEFMRLPEPDKLLSGWGRTGDKLIIAENEKDYIGAAWYRLWTEQNHFYGFVDSKTPELGIGIRKGYRSQGIGRMLLRQLIKTAEKEGYRALSLSVDPENFARYLYESAGFLKVEKSGTSWTYKLDMQ